MKCKCDECKNNCCGKNFIGLANSFKHSNSDLFNQILLSEEEVDDIVEHFGDEFIEYIDGLPYIALNEDRSCKAFKNGRCSIYAIRPDVCKLYPYYFDPFGGIFIDKNCECFDDSSQDMGSVLELANKRIKLFSKLEGLKHNSERQGKEISQSIYKDDLIKIIDKIDFIDIKNNVLHIMGKNMLDIAQKYATPLSVGFVDVISTRINSLKQLFADAIQRHNFNGKYNYAYATKANYFSEVVHTSSKNCDMLEFSSEYDLEILIQLIKLKHFNKNMKVICNGLKNDNYISKIKILASKGIKLLVILNNEEEYDLLKKHNITNIEIGIRYACEDERRLYLNNYDNFDIAENRFGVDKLGFEKLLKRIKREKLYTCSVFHFHFGGEITNLRNYLKAFENVCEYFINLAKKYPNFKYLDFGGGFPSQLNTKISIPSLVDGIVKTVAKYANESSINFDIIGEHGRYTTAEHGVYIFKIEQKVKNYNKLWAIINNSLMNCLPDIWGLQSDFILLPINGWDKEFEPCYLGGKTCDEDDKFFVENKNKQVLLPKTNQEIYIAILGIGAYQEMLSGGSLYSHCLMPKAYELVIVGDKEKSIKSSNSIKQTLRNLSYTKSYLKNFK